MHAELCTCIDIVIVYCRAVLRLDNRSYIYFEHAQHTGVVVVVL